MSPNLVQQILTHRKSVFSRFEQFVAFRFFRRAEGREESRRFVRFVTNVAIGGVAVGVGALLLTLAIVQGFSEEIRSKLIGIVAHVQVDSIHDEPLNEAQSLQVSLAEVEGVDTIVPLVEEFALLRRSSRDIDGVLIRGVEDPSPFFEERLVDGTFDFAPDSLGRPGLVIGEQLATLLSISLGDHVTAFSMRQLSRGASSFAAVRPQIEQFHVAGIYETSFAEFDELLVFTDLLTARPFFNYTDNQVSRFDINVVDESRTRQVADRIDEQFDVPIRTLTVFQTHSNIFAWVRLQESIIPLVLLVITGIGIANIVGILLMITIEKTHAIGVLMSMGASAKSIRRLFLWLGLMIGAAGIVIGELLALVLGFLQSKFELIPLPAEAYYMTSAPISMNPLDFLIVGVATLILCGLAAYIPARVASNVEPIRAIRFR